MCLTVTNSVIFVAILLSQTGIGSKLDDQNKQDSAGRNRTQPGAEDVWKELLDIARSRTSQEQEKEKKLNEPLENDYVDLKELFLNEETESFSNETQNDAAFITDVRPFDEVRMWDRLINSRDDFMGLSEGPTEEPKQQVETWTSDVIQENFTLESMSLTVESPEEKPEEPIRGSSLAFVFDSTGSMHDELAQVKVGASKILAALRDHPDIPIHNYVLVPFNDPDIGPVTVTTDHKLFRERIEDITVIGGGDCPEMTVGAIKKALEVSLPNSYIYVFTDASAKDSRLQNEVLSLIQRKQAQVVFIMTDDCKDLDKISYQVYERIAETSSGQVYRLSKSEVKEVLKYVKVALQPNVVYLLSQHKPAPRDNKPDEHEVMVDETLKQFTVSVSGTNASISVTDPKGKSIDGPPQLESLLTLKNVKVVNVKEPDPGPWKVMINSDSDYTVRSTGLSGVHFNHGFSTVETSNLRETNHRPLKGAECYILIQTSDWDKVHNLTTVDIVGLNGETIQQFELEAVPGVRGAFKGGGFIPPSTFFYLGITGFGKDGFPIKRITTTAISPQLPEKPVINMRAKTVGHIDRPIFLKCHVESVVPFTVQWYKDGRPYDKEQNYSQTCEAVVEIKKSTLQSEGNFTCRASNVAGIAVKTTHLSITGDPPSVKVSSRVVSSPGETVGLDCVVESILPSTVSWSQFTATNEHSGILHAVSKGIQLENNTLVIKFVSAEDEGWYVCTAVNKGGRTQGRAFLLVKDPLKVVVEPENLSFVEGDSARFTCSATGKPQPRLEWRRNQHKITNEDLSVITEEVNGKLNLMLDYLEKKHEGFYTCNAMNTEETVTAAVELVYTEKPLITAKENNMMVKVGSSAVLQCFVTGIPKPTVRWLRGGLNIVESSRFHVKEDGVLQIESTRSVDAGEYSCVGENVVGFDTDYIGLFVGSPPSFLQKPKDKIIEIYHNGTIPCSAIGMPPAEIKWKRMGGLDLNERMFTLPSGALRIVNMQFEDAGFYLCAAENVFGSISSQVLIDVSGIEKPVLDNHIILTDVKTISGDEVTIPCGLIMGNPPGIMKWFKDGIEVKPDDLASIDEEGNLILDEVSSQNRGNYTCWASNVVGNSSRTYQIVVSESPKILKDEKSDLKATKGGEIVIPCPVEGYPPPQITWIKNGSPLPMSSTIFQDKNGSLIIRNVNVESGGTYVCTAVNAIGSASKATSVHVQVPPVITEDPRGTSLNIVEGHVVVLNCNVNAMPVPTIQWFKNNESLLQNEEKVHSQPEILRFVANVEDTGVYRCVAVNEVGKASKEFNVTILVPPNILGRSDEESIKAKAGIPITLLCNVHGVPRPTILWQRNGMYLTQNTSDITILETGLLIIQNVSKESSGAYICDAENMAGITQRIYYLQVLFPPKIVEEVNVSFPIRLKEGDEYSLPCLVEGNPKPVVTWRKNGFPLFEHQSDLIVLADNTLVLLQVTRESTGIYRCEADNAEGSVHQEFEVEVITPPSAVPEDYPTKLEVSEGDSLVLTCPTSSIPPPNIHWIKDGNPLNSLLQERSDEAQMKLSEDQRSLTIVEAHPSDNGNYSCVATNLAGRTDAKFVVDVLMIPHFEEFNHIAHRTILAGGEVTLNCSVSGNPVPKVTWRKGTAPISPQNTPGVHVSLDKQHLVIPTGRVHHSGTYVCSAANKVSTKEREFYITVLEAPRITGPQHETVDVMKGGNLSLHCPVSGVPEPTVVWSRMNKVKRILDNSSKDFVLRNVDCNDEGMYACEATNTAGTKIKLFNVTVLEPPVIERHDVTEEVEVPVGGNVTLKCKTSGQPRPEITWLHNGHILNRSHIRARRHLQVEYFGELTMSDDGSASLSLSNITESNKGLYTVLAANKAGIVEKNFEVKVLVPPNLADEATSEALIVVHPFPIIIRCPAQGDPMPELRWFRNDEILDDENEKELRIEKSDASHSGNYSCFAVNPAGNLTRSFVVKVIEPPKIEENADTSFSFVVGEDLVLNCNGSGDGDPKILWLRSSTPLANSSRIFLLDGGKTLVVSNLTISDSGSYSCIVTNIAGAAESSYDIQVYKSPTLTDESLEHFIHKKTNLHRPFSLHCPFVGHPSPKISWFKDEVLMNESRSDTMQTDGTYLTVLSAGAKDAGDYRCLAENRAGAEELKFKVEVIVIGEWTPWSEWSQCSTTCGLGEQSRERICSIGIQDLDPRLQVDKSKCEGEDFQKRKCLTECQVDGAWTSWSSWTSCSSSCGKATRKRYRTCENPEPANGGKYCFGPDSQEEFCDLEPCPVNGQWSHWGTWSECSASCAGGKRSRHRDCNAPAPSNDGQTCGGDSMELVSCNQHKCSGQGRWMPWSDWSPCSNSCGKGHKKRHRRCKPSRRGKTCKGENLQIEKCFVRNCNEAFPSSASLHVTGKLNGKPINDRIDADIKTLSHERLVSANMNDLLQEQNKKWFPYSPFLLSPLSWNTAYETDEANNGYSLTSGNYFSQSDIQFATGEGLIVKHKGEGVDPYGALQVEIEVAGEVPLIEPHASVVIKSMDQDFVQTGANSLYSSVQNDVDIEGQKLGFSWNSSIFYDTEQGTMPYLVEKLSMKDIYNLYNPDTHNVSYVVSSSIGKKYEDNKCPAGFVHEQQHMHCKDIDECDELDNLCSEGQLCENTFGSFKCVCRYGYQPSDDGAGCSDVDECELRPSICSHGCHNTQGSFLCSCPVGQILSADLRTCAEEHVGNEENFYHDDFNVDDYRTYFAPDLTFNRSTSGKRLATSDKWDQHLCPTGYYSVNYECKDYNECLDDHQVCNDDETCLNTQGAFRCLSTPCPSGFERSLSSSCMRYCDTDRTNCPRGTLVSETVTFNAVTLNTVTPVNTILLLDVLGQPEHHLTRTRFRVVESGELFRVRQTHGRGSLYALRSLRTDTIYRVKIEGMSFNSQSQLVYFTEFVIFIVVNSP